MSYLERKTGKISRINSLPNYTAAGSYCFFSQCIQLNTLEYKDFLSFIDIKKPYDEAYKDILKFGPLLSHEVKHWYDAHSTLWGLKLLKDIYCRRNDLYEAEMSGISTKLPHFFRQKELYDRIEYIKLPEYYSTVNSKANTTKPWKYEFSAGIMFSKCGKPSDRSVFFTRFTNADGELIARVPFSLCSLLESSAVAQELNGKVRAIAMLDDPVSKKIESNNLSKSITDELYNENLVEYSVVAHKISNSFDISDVLESYNIAAKLTRLILNLTNDVIILLDPEAMLLPKFEAFVIPYKNALKHIDHGAIFSLFVDALDSQYQSKGTQVSNENLENLLDSMFKEYLGLSCMDIFEKSKVEVKNICTPVNFDLSKEHLNSSLKLGQNLHKQLGLVGSHFINLDDNFIPDFMLGDGTLISQTKPEQKDFEDRYLQLNEYFEYLSNFSKACIV